MTTLKTMAKHAYIKRLLKQEEARDVDAYLKAGRLPPELWGYDIDADGELLVQGLRVNELARQYGTPLHLVNEEELIDTYREFLGSFEAVYPNVVLGTSYKTNPLPHVISTLHDAGSWAEVISHFELWLALKLGVSPDRILLNGPGKGDDALSLAVDKRVRLINVDGPEEIPKIAQMARARGVTQKVGLRVITSVGWSSQFGLSLSSGAALAAFEQMLAHPELEPVGIHLHLGTGIQNVEVYVQAVTELWDFSQELKARHDIDIDFFDLGGGFGVPTVRGLTDWDLRMVSLGYPARSPNPRDIPRTQDYAKALKPVLDKIAARKDEIGAWPQVLLEPGRAITSSAQTLSLSVLGQKEGVNGKQYLILDGGKNISMPLGWETHQIFAANRMNESPSQMYDLFGPLCHPGDIVVKNKEFPRLEAGDVLTIMDAGAYFIPNQMNFSNPRPPVVSISDGAARIVREREKFEDIVRLDNTG